MVNWHSYFYIFLAGGILFAAASNAILFALRPRERTSGCFALVCLAFAINMLIPNTSGLPLEEIFPFLSGNFLFRLDMATLAVGIWSTGLLMQVLFPFDTPQWIVKLLFPVMALAATLAFTLPPSVFYPVFRGFIALVSLVCLFWVYLVIRALILKRADSRLVVAGAASCSIAGIVDAVGILSTGKPFFIFLVPVSLIVFIPLLSFIVARRFADSLLDSERLRNDLKQITRHEQHLRDTQRQLTEMLNKVPLPVCSAGGNGEIVFASEHVCRLLGKTTESLRGLQIDTFLKSESGKTLLSLPGKLCDGPENVCRSWVPAVISGSGGDQSRFVVEIVPLSIGNENLTVFVLHPLRNSPLTEQTLALFIEELRHNRQRIERLDGTVCELIKNSPADAEAIRAEFDAIDSALDQMTSALKQPLQDRREIAREIVCLSVSYWKECTGETSLALARQSGLWRVEVSPDGFERARTLEKYLDIRTFPRVPPMSSTSHTRPPFCPMK